MSVLVLSKLSEIGRGGLIRRARIEPGTHFIVGRGAALRFYTQREARGAPLMLLVELDAYGRRVHLEVDPLEPRPFLAALEAADLHLIAVEFQDHRVAAIHIELRHQAGSIHATA